MQRSAAGAHATVLLALVASCAPASPAHTKTGPSAVLVPSASDGTGPAPSQSAEATATGSSSGRVRVDGVRTDSARSVAIRVANGTATALSLAREVVVERAVGPRWESIGVTMTYLRANCSLPIPEGCVNVAPGAEFRAAAWRAMSGDGQCDCEECGPVDGGSYRYVVTSCDGKTRYEGSAFDVPPR